MANIKQPTGHNATATLETLAAPAIPTRDSLSFTQSEPNGHPNNWAVPHAPKDNWSDTVPRGRAFFAEVVELARHDPEEARQAILWALTAPGFTAGWGEEHGFAECVAKAAVSAIGGAA